MLAALGRSVTVTLKSSETFRGNLYSIDPLTFAVLLLKDSNPATMAIIMEHAILALHSMSLLLQSRLLLFSSPVYKYRLPSPSSRRH